MRMTASWSGPHGPTEYKVVARCSVPDGKLPSDRRPDRVKRDVVLRAVKVWPGQGGACGKIGATANLDGSCARRGEQRARRDEETAVRSNKETDEGEKMRCAGENPLTKNTPYKACSGFTHVTARRIAQSPKARLQPFRLPGRAARQLPDQSTTIRVESSSTGDSRLRGALPSRDVSGGRSHLE